MEQALSKNKRLVMHASHTLFDMLAIQSSWQAFDTMAHLRPIHDEENYDRMTKLMNSLLDATGVDEDHSLSGLLDLVGDLVSMCEQSHHVIEPAEPRDALRFLMNARGLKQDDLSFFVPPKQFVDNPGRKAQN